jgi:hypothetical protein
MNNTIYKISGRDRRNKKKELSQLKHFTKMFWYYEDIDRVYGGGLEDTKCHEILEKTNTQIQKIETELKELL